MISQTVIGGTNADGILTNDNDTFHLNWKLKLFLSK